MNDRFIQGISLDWDKLDRACYVWEIPALRQLSSLAFSSNVTFFVGENATGKSTLLEAVAVACGFNPEGGTKNYQFSTYDSHSPLYQAVTVIRGYKRPKNSYFLRAESFYNVATKAEEYETEWGGGFFEQYGGKPLHQQSHGESFLALAQGTFRQGGFYILDEPEAALSPQRQLTLLAQMDKLAKGGAQFLVASHSPILLGLPGAEIYSFTEEGIASVSYEETDSYQVMEMFINNREQLLYRLLAER